MLYWKITFWINFGLLVLYAVCALAALGLGQPVVAVAALAGCGMGLACAMSIGTFLASQENMAQAFDDNLMEKAVLIRELNDGDKPTDEEGPFSRN